MNCETFESRLNDLLDQRLSPETDSLLQAHAGACSDCRDRLAAQAVLWEALAFSNVPEPPSGFARQVVAEVMPTRRPPRLSRTLVAVAAVAALVLIAVIPVIRGRFTGPGHVTPNEVATDTDEPSNEQDSPPPRIVEFSDTQEAAPSETMLADGSTEPRVEDLKVPYEGLLQQIPEKLPDVSAEDIDSDKIPGVRPIRSSFSTGVSLIRRTLPGGKSREHRHPDARQ